MMKMNLQKINYQKELEKLLTRLEKEEKVPTLLLHSCCAPCSSYVLEYLSQYFKITVFYYNPNIYPMEEYEKRKNEVLRLIKLFNQEYQTNVDFIEEKDDFNCYLEKKVHVKGCMDCFHLRLLKSFTYANKNHYDYVTTTLTVGRLKNSILMNQIAESLQPMFTKTHYLYSDFKKNKGIEISLNCKEKYGIYAQCYCGCEPYYRNKKTI